MNKTQVYCLTVPGGRWRLKRNWIPPITDPMGKHWQQPDRHQIHLIEDYAYMDREAFNQLYAYNSTNPSGTYPGKMWRRRRANTWWLVWYSFDPEPGMLTIHFREIKLTDLIP